MPFYDFRCANNHRFELKQSYSAEPVTNCPTCAQPAKRLISLVPVHFKGSGFYVNDYGKKDQPSSEGKDGKGAEGKDGKLVEATAKGPDAAKTEAAKSEPPKSAKADSPKTESSSKDKAPSTGGKDKSFSSAAPSKA